MKPKRTFPQCRLDLVRMRRRTCTDERALSPRGMYCNGCLVTNTGYRIPTDPTVTWHKYSPRQLLIHSSQHVLQSIFGQLGLSIPVLFSILTTFLARSEFLNGLDLANAIFLYTTLHQHYSAQAFFSFLYVQFSAIYVKDK